MCTFDHHLPDEYEYCRRCGLLIVGPMIDRRQEPCDPPDARILVERRLASIVATNNIEGDVQWAIRSLTDDAMRKQRSCEDDPDAT